MPKHLLPILAIALLLTAGCKRENTTANHTPDPGQPAPLEKVTVGSTKPLHVTGDVYLAGQPSEEDLALFKARGVKTVINLRHTAETPDLDEDKIVQGLGMTYVHLPWSGKEQLTNAKLDQMRLVLKTSAADGPVLLHCASANRVGAGWLAYRVLDQGVELEAAIKEAKTVGMRSKQYEEKAVAYIKRKQKAEKSKNQ